MGKYHETSATIPFRWDQVATAFWKRYPNPYSSHVLSEDTLDRKLKGDELYTKRLITKTSRAPKWGERFAKSSVVAVVEESLVNRADHTITTYTRNIGLTRIMSVVEKVVYKIDPENKSQTVASRAAWIDSQMYGFRRAIEGFGVDRFKKNCSQAILGFNYVLNNLFPYESGVNQLSNVTLRKGETAKETLKAKARLAGERAKERAGSMGSVYAASSDS